MSCPILSENQTKRLHLPYPMLVCFAMFNAWQMGFIYFAGPSLVVNGRTPLPISMDNITTAIVAAYLLAIILMIAIPAVFFIYWRRFIPLTFSITAPSTS